MGCKMPDTSSVMQPVGAKISCCQSCEGKTAGFKNAPAPKKKPKKRSR